MLLWKNPLDYSEDATRVAQVPHMYKTKINVQVLLSCLYMIALLQYKQTSIYVINTATICMTVVNQFNVCWSLKSIP